MYNSAGRQHIAGESEISVVYREFSYESPGERIFKIGPHLPKFIIKKRQGAYLFGTQCNIVYWRFGIVVVNLFEKVMHGIN